MHLVLVNHLGGLSLGRNSDHTNMTLAVKRGCKEQQNNNNNNKITKRIALGKDIKTVAQQIFYI